MNRDTKYLRNLDASPHFFNNNQIDSDKLKQEVLKDIVEGRLAPIKK